MMTTKLKSFLVLLAHSVEKSSQKQCDFTLRKSFAVCLIAMVAQVCVAGEWSGNVVTYPFSRYSNNYSFSSGAKVTNYNRHDLYLVLDETHKQLDNKFAAFNISDWKLDGSGWLQDGGGDRELSILRLYEGTKVKIVWSNVTESNTIRFFDTSQVSNLNVNTLKTDTFYTMSKEGNLDLLVGRKIRIESIIIDYGNDKHILFTDSIGYSASGNKNGYTYYRYRLSSRKFGEPKVSIFPSGSGTYTYEYSVENYGTSVGSKGVAVMSTSEAGDLLFNNLGWCIVTVKAKQNGNEVARGSYLVEVWDDEAYYEIDETASGLPYKYKFVKKAGVTDDNQGGVLKSRTVTAIPGVVMKFSIPTDNSEPNTTVVYRNDSYGTDHMVSFTNDNNGWWDRSPNNNSTAPTQGTFYSFQATASGKLKFGGVKVYQNSNNQSWDYSAKAGGVYLVKGTNFVKTWVFGNGESGYLTTEGRTVTDENGGASLVNGAINIEAGVTYYLQGEAKKDNENDNNSRWSPFLLEWFSYETALELSKSYGIAPQPGKDITGSITTDAKVTLNDAALNDGQRTSISSGIKTEFKGHINGATVTLNSSDYITISNVTYNNNGNENLKGGAIKIKVANGSDTIVYVYTIPYGTHVWDFRNTADQTGASRVTDQSYTDSLLCSNMKANTKDWSRVYKVHSKSGGSWSDIKDPLMVAGSKIEGNNAFYMSNTAGLIFVTNDIESFGAQQTGFPKGYSSLSVDDQYLQGADSISATNLVWMKGTSTIYFPGLTQNQYIKIYTYRHAGDKGENFYAHNLVDLDGKDYNNTSATEYFKLRGATDETGLGIRGDGIKGAAIFRVPNGYSYSNFNNNLANLPSLTLCDDGWVKIYRIEVMDAYEPDLVLIRNKNTGEAADDLVTYDSKSGSVALKNNNGTVSSVTYQYLGTSGNIRAQHANTPRYEISPDAGVNVTASIENWQSERHVDYNQLKLVFSGGNGNVKIIQREITNKIGSAVLVGHDVVEVEGVKTYPDRTPITLTNNTSDVTATDYVIDKNEYIISVGEISVQTYPYTWDFTNHNYNNGRNNTTQTNMAASSQTVSTKNHWTGVWPKDTLNPTGLKVMGENPVANPNRDPYQSLILTVPGFAQGADLKTTTSSTTAVVRECEGLGVSTPIATNKKSILKSGSTFEYEVYKSDKADAISLDGNALSGLGKITIPDVDQGMYIFVSMQNGSPKYGEVTAGGNPITIIYSGNDIFSLKGGVYCYYQNQEGKKDVVIPLDGSSAVKQIAVTDKIKQIGSTGYATESRDTIIDHTYQDKLTNHPVKAYYIDTYNGSAYDYNGYPEVKKLGPVAVVPVRTGVVLYEDKNVQDHGNFKTPLFVPAVNNMTESAEDAANRAKNWLAPSVAWDKTGLAKDGVTFGNEGAWKIDAMTGVANQPNNAWCTKFILTNTYYTYYKRDGSTSTSGPHTANTAAFYRLKLNGNATTDKLGGNKSYLLIQNVPTALWAGGSGAREGMIYIDLQDWENDNDATLVNEAVAERKSEPDVYYTISGTRVNGRPTAKGIYICNGKKVSIK